MNVGWRCCFALLGLLVAAACTPANAGGPGHAADLQPVADTRQGAAGVSAPANCPQPLPVASPTPIVVPAITTGLGPCVMVLPTELPAPTPTAGAGLSAASAAPARLTLTAGNDELLGVFPVDAGLVAYRNAGAGGAISLSSLTGATITLTGEAVAVARRADGVLSLGVLQSGRLLIYSGANINAAQTATPIELLAGAADDLALGYGPDGWLYAAAGGTVQRFDPFNNLWQNAGGYTGAAVQLTRTSAGDQLLLTTAGVFRKALTASAFGLVVDTRQGAAGLPGVTAASRLAVWGERVAYAWSDGRRWQVMDSSDSGASWSAAQAVAELSCDCAREAWAAFNGGALEVVGVLIDDPMVQPADKGGDAGEAARLPAAPDQAFPYLAVIRQAGAEWYPPVQATVYEALFSLDHSQPVGRARCASEQGRTVCAWEARQWSGTYDVQATTR